MSRFIFKIKCEMGTRTELGRKWTACGHRPQEEQIIEYEYGYLSAALNPARGKLFALLAGTQSG